MREGPCAEIQPRVGAQIYAPAPQIRFMAIVCMCDQIKTTTYLLRKYTCSEMQKVAPVQTPEHNGIVYLADNGRFARIACTHIETP